MFLKSLILRGFKTFADLTEIEFPPESRITAVVGPNGCGKSNVLDATRWVLGEDNPRELRVASLADIIFAGTATRKPLSLAEITLVFDNSSGRFAAPYTEVSIKRRTFREGESEFFINKNTCRLKDIKDLLADTGLGEGSYSIITQGQVDAILSSKGDERRAVFEEAAGINKYKTRKLSAEKKMIAAEQNILRISDLKIEVSEHLINLEEQARKAREYLDIQSRVKELDLGLGKRQIASIFEKRHKIIEELDNVKKEAETKKQSEEKELAELVAFKENYRRLEREIDEAIIKQEGEKDQLRDLELDRRFLEGDLERMGRTLESLKQRELETRQKIDELQQKLAENQKEFDLAGHPLGAFLQTIMDQTQQLINHLSGLFAAAGLGQSLTLSLNLSADKEEAYKLKLEMLTEEVGKLAAEKEKSDFAYRAYQSQLTDLMKNLDGARSQQTASEAIVSKRAEKDSLSQKIAALEDKLRVEGQAERKVLDQENALQIALAKLEGEMNGLQEKLSLEYNLNIEEVSTLPYEISNVAKSKIDVEEGKRRLRALEPVNLLAIEEYEKAKERLTFIDAQLTDLNAARENLRQLIIELDQKAEQTFSETMEKLSVVFSETFSKLFVGGEAKISLSPGVSALEAEIDISVRPSGRKWLPLPLLSGGERALSAIAILFSLLIIRPSPFCFLDEVDAALDEANIGRFNQMLKDFSVHSQIIVITHNKRTMSVADSIYGVTMEEPGVSRVISMKLAEVAK